MNVAVCIGIAIAIIVGVALVPVVVETVNSSPAVTNSSQALDAATGTSVGSGLTTIIPIIFIVVLIIGAVGFIASTQSGDTDRSDTNRKRKSKKKKVNTSPINVNLARMDNVDRNIGTEIGRNSAIKRN